MKYTIISTTGIKHEFMMILGDAYLKYYVPLKSSPPKIYQQKCLFYLYAEFASSCNRKLINIHVVSSMDLGL